MHAWESIQKTVDYIEDNLSRKLEMPELAQVACLSPFYFQRLFARLVERPPMEYIRLRRLARAAERLEQGSERILDVALDLGFSGHEVFTRAFKEAYGITPEELRKGKVMLKHFRKPELMLQYTLIDEDVPLITDSIVLEVGRRKQEEQLFYRGLSRQVEMEYTEHQPGVDSLSTLWDEVHKCRREGKISGLLQGEEGVGVSTYGDTMDRFTYFAGARCQPEGEDGRFESWQMPRGEFIVCDLEAEDFTTMVSDTLIKAMNYLFQIWLPAHELATESYMVERYLDTTPEAAAMEIWVKGVPLPKE